MSHLAGAGRHRGLHRRARLARASAGLRRACRAEIRSLRPGERKAHACEGRTRNAARVICATPGSGGQAAAARGSETEGSAPQMVVSPAASARSARVGPICRDPGCGLLRRWPRRPCPAPAWGATRCPSTTCASSSSAARARGSSRSMATGTSTMSAAAGANILGHAHPAVMAAVRPQIEGKGLHFFGTLNDTAVELAEKLVGADPLRRAHRLLQHRLGGDLLRPADRPRLHRPAEDPEVRGVRLPRQPRLRRLQPVSRPPGELSRRARRIPAACRRCCSPPCWSPLTTT